LPVFNCPPREDWDNGFRTQTGQNINVAANGIAKLLRMMIEEDN